MPDVTENEITQFCLVIIPCRLIFMRFSLPENMPQSTPLFIFIDLLAILSLLTGIFTSCLILLTIGRKLTSNHATANLLLANTCPGRALLNPYTIVYDRALPNTLRITVVFLRNTWLSITIVILRVVYDRS